MKKFALLLNLVGVPIGIWLVVTHRPDAFWTVMAGVSIILGGINSALQLLGDMLPIRYYTVFGYQPDARSGFYAQIAAQDPGEAERQARRQMPTRALTIVAVLEGKHEPVDGAPHRLIVES